MTETKKCRKCGELVRTNAPFGHCPRCLLELGFGPAPEGVFESSATGTKVRQFGDYDLLEQIGRGGMGVVFRARQRSLNRLVALKMILNVESASPGIMARFHDEAEAAAKLEHPNIVSTYEFGELDGQPFLCMRLIEGSNLAKQMPQLALASLADGQGQATVSKPHRREAQERIARLMATIARAIHYAHQQNVVHRDLKPTNILMDEQNRPYLTDFGIAKILTGETDLTGRSEILGTANYMAPEQAAGQRAAFAADIYSLGVILYELLTGRLPFRADTPMETLRRATEEEPTHPTTLNRQADRELATICLKCLEKDPLRRYASAETMAEDLDRWLRHEPIHARRASAGLRLRRWTRRNPAGALLVLALFLGLTVLLALLKIVHEKEATKEEALVLLREPLKEQLNDLWAHPEKSASVVITSETRAVLAPGERGTVGTAPAQRIRFGIYSHDQIPTEMLPKFSPLLAYLEKSLSEKLHAPIRVNFLIFRDYQAAMLALLTNGVDFARFGAASYVIAKGSNAAVSIVAVQTHESFQGAIFTQATNQAIQRLEDLRGRTLAFGNTNSTTGSQLAKFHLAGLGFHARDFSNRATNYLRNHADVTNAVAQGKFDAGAAKESYVRNANFRILSTFPNLGMVWVATPHLRASNRQALTESLLSVKLSLVEKLEDAVTGFERGSDNGYEELRQRMKTAEEFERR